MKKPIIALVCALFLNQSAFSSCSEIIGKELAVVEKDSIGEIVQDVGLVVSTAGGGMTTTGYSATSSSASTTAGAATLIVPGWIVLGSGLVISAAGGVMQLTQPQKKAITNVYTLFNQADLAAGTSLERFANGVRVDLNVKAEELTDAQISKFIRQGDNKEVFCPRNIQDPNLFNIMTVDQIQAEVVIMISKKFAE